MQMLENEAPDKANATASGRAVPLREFNLLRWYAWVSLAIIVSVAAGLGLISSRFIIVVGVERDALLGQEDLAVGIGGIGAPHGNLGNFAALAPQLVANHEARVAKDREFKWWAEDVARFRAERDKKSISLNETVRRAERDRLEAERKQRRAERIAAGLDVDEDAALVDDGLAYNERSVIDQAAEEEAAKNGPDPLLRESAAILADALDLLSANLLSPVVLAFALGLLCVGLIGGGLLWIFAP